MKKYSPTKEVMTMKNFILASILTLGLVSMPAMAGITTDDINLRELTETQKAALVQMTEEMRAKTKAVEDAAENAVPTEAVITVEKVSEYTMLGKEVASAFIALAAELGKTVDEVLSTTIGKVALALIVYKIAGDDILGVVGGMIWLLIFVPGWIYYMRKFVLVGTVTEEYFADEESKIRKLKKRTIEPAMKHLNSDQRAVRAWTFGIILGIGVVVEILLVFA